MKKLNLIFPLGWLLLILIYSCTSTESGKEAKYWPQFRGVNCSGLASENAKPPIEFNEKNLLWKTELPIGHSSPCIWGDNIFISGCIPDENKLEMICIDRRNGEIKWQHSLSVEKLETVHSAVGNAAHSTPTTDGKYVYFYFGSYGLQCYDTDGHLMWEKRFPVRNARYGSASSPILHNDMLILCRDYIGEEKLYALNKTTGDSIWIANLPEKPELFRYPSYSTPVIWKECIVVHRMWQSTAHSIRDGSLKWWITLPTNGNSTPVINDDILYYGAWYELSEQEQRGELPDFKTMISRHDMNKDGLIERNEIPSDMIFFQRPGNDLQQPWYLRGFFGYFDPDKDGFSREEEWVEGLNWVGEFTLDGGLFAIKPEGEGEQSTKTIIWEVNDKVPEVPSPLYYDNLVYMCKDGGILTCMDAKDGAILYRESIGSLGSFIASPVMANEHIYFTSAKGVITVVKAGEKFEIVKQSNLKENVFATPAIIENSFYIRAQENLYAYK